MILTFQLKVDCNSTKFTVVLRVNMPLLLTRPSNHIFLFSRWLCLLRPQPLSKFQPTTARAHLMLILSTTADIVKL